MSETPKCPLKKLREAAPQLLSNMEHPEEHRDLLSNTSDAKHLPSAFLAFSGVKTGQFHLWPRRFAHKKGPGLKPSLWFSVELFLHVLFLL